MKKTKQKTKKSITKRFRITKNGKVIRRQSFTGHLKVKKSKKRLGRLKRPKLVTGFFAKKLKKRMGTKKRVRTIKK